VDSGRTLAVPKSMILILKFLPRTMFSGFKSRWMTPWVCRVVHCLHNLSQVVDHYLSLFQSQVEFLIDVAHQCEDVSMRTQLHDQTDIPLIPDKIVQLYDPWVAHLLQNHHLQGSLVDLLHVL
jgi:hypothetical protein